MPTAVDMNSPIAYWSNTGLVIGAAHHCVEHAINIAPNLSLKEGTIMGEITATPGTFAPYAGSTVGTPAAITPTLTAFQTGGTLLASTAYYVVFTYINGVGETVKSTEATVTTAAGTATNSILVATPVPLPPGAIGIKVYLGTVSGTNNYVGTSPLTTFTVTGLAPATLAPPGSSTALAATNGQEKAKCVLRYPVTTDAAGNILVGLNASSVTGIPIVAVQSGVVGSGLTQPSIDALFWGFECDLTLIIGLDQAALTAGFGRIENGVIGGTYGRFVLN